MAAENLYAGANDGVTNGTTKVTLVAAPATGKRRVRFISVGNVDTVAAIVQIVYSNGASDRVIFSKSIATLEGLEYPGNGVPIVLDETDTSLSIKLNAAVTTNELDWYAGFEEFGEEFE